jgi:hypothetical protein
MEYCQLPVENTILSSSRYNSIGKHTERVEECFEFFRMSILHTSSIKKEFYLTVILKNGGPDCLFVKT